MKPASTAARAALVCLLGVLGQARGVSAQDRWREPHRGVRHLHRRVGLFDYHLVRVDLAAARPRFVATEESFLDPRTPGAPRVWRTTSDFARHVGADLAVNANYFDIRHGRFSTCGLAMAAGRVWRSSYADRRLDCDWSMGFGARGGVALFDAREKVFGPAPFSWVTEAVTGSPRILGDGEVLSYSHPRHALQRNPRTILAVDRDRRTLFVMMVNGREGRNQGMTCPEAARALRDHGAWDAVNLDGGGSSALYLRAEGGLVSHPADGTERGVGNHLGIVFGDGEGVALEGPPDGPAPAEDPPKDEVVAVHGMSAPAPVETRVVRAGCGVTPARPAAPSFLAALGAFIVSRRRRPAPAKGSAPCREGSRRPRESA
jgi:hypothetical protein